MHTAQTVAVESKLAPAVAHHESSFGKPRSAKQRRHEEDITAWLEEQEDAEMTLLVKEMAGRNHREGRRSCRAR